MEAPSTELWFCEELQVFTQWKPRPEGNKVNPKFVKLMDSCSDKEFFIIESMLRAVHELTYTKEHVADTIRHCEKFVKVLLDYNLSIK